MPRKTTSKTTRRTAVKKRTTTVKKKVTRKPVKKRATKRTPKKEVKYTFPKKFQPYYERKEIKLSSKVYNALVISPSTDDQGYPLLFLLGEDNKKIVREMVQIKREIFNQGGCGQMPDVNAEELTQGYLALAKQNLMPVGICRTRDSFVDYDGAGHWCSDAGSAITHLGLVLTVAERTVIAEVFVPRYPDVWKKGNRNADGYWSGTHRELTVLLTDK